MYSALTGRELSALLLLWGVVVGSNAAVRLEDFRGEGRPCKRLLYRQINRVLFVRCHTETRDRTYEGGYGGRGYDVIGCYRRLIEITQDLGG
uniref:Putative secreted protein n=1 Tax=Ixodes ricinus TaxID=34613 RepID=A0A6B0U1V3_IXORI